MIKTAIGVAAGAAGILAAIYGTGGHGYLFVFLIGAAVPVLIIAAALTNARTVRRIANSAEQLAVILEGGTKRTRRDRPASAPAAIVSPVQIEVAAALVQMKARKSQANSAAARAVAMDPAGTFETVFRQAVQLLYKPQTA